MPSLKEWIRNKFPRSKDAPIEHIPDPPPFLPVQRPSILTPSPSREALISYTESYGYFQRLPYEIRRLILIEALGGRTLHIDLLYEKRGVRGNNGKWIINDDGTCPQAKHPSWGWFSCVCHQPNLWPEGIPRRNFGEREIENPRRLPCAGGCVQYMRNHRECGPWEDGRMPPGCRTYVMGWLLACRQAYAEGIDVIFATNTIHMENYDLLRNLPRIILPQRLHVIESLEISWTFSSSVGKRNHRPLEVLWEDPAMKDSELHEMCRMVPNLFTHLRRLDIHLHSNINEPYPLSITVPGGTEALVLGPIEDMIRVLGPGPEICIAIQQSYFDYLAFRKVDPPPREVKVEWYNPYTTRFWKELDASNGLGYWICRGYPDHCRLGMTVFENY